MLSLKNMPCKWAYDFFLIVLLLRSHFKWVKNTSLNPELCGKHHDTQYRECFKATKIYKDNSRVWRLRVVGESVCLFNFLNSRTIHIQIPSSPIIPNFTEFSLEQMRQSQNVASARATQEGLILNIKNPSHFYDTSFYAHTIVWVINMYEIIYKEKFWRLSVHGAQHNQRKWPERWGKGWKWKQACLINLAFSLQREINTYQVIQNIRHGP